MPIDPIAIPALAAILTAGCPQPPDVKARVLGHVGDTAETMSLSLAQIRALSENVGGSRAHEPYGFYISRAVDRIAVEIGNPRNDLCAGPVRVDVILSLGGRHIEMGQELRHNACLLAAVTAHYRRHAAADAAVFRDYVPIVIKALAKAPLPRLIETIGNTDDSNKKIARAVQNIIDPILDDMQTAQAAALDSVDTPAEIKRLNPDCHPGT